MRLFLRHNKKFPLLCEIQMGNDGTVWLYRESDKKTSRFCCLPCRDAPWRVRWSLAGFAWFCLAGFTWLGSALLGGRATARPYIRLTNTGVINPHVLFTKSSRAFCKILTSFSQNPHVHFLNSTRLVGELTTFSWRSKRAG